MLFGDEMRILAVLLLTGCMGSIEGHGDEAPPNSDPLAGCAMSCHGTDTSKAPPIISQCGSSIFLLPQLATDAPVLIEEPVRRG